MPKIRRQVILFTIVFLVLSCTKSPAPSCSYIRDYYQLVYKAEEMYYLEKYQEVYDLMMKATSKCALIDQRGIYEMYKFAESTARIGKDEEALDLIEKLILNGYILDDLANNDGFSLLLQTDGWKKLQLRSNDLREQYLMSINLDIRAEIKQMTYNDQLYRGQGATSQDSIWKLQKEIDDYNDKRLKEIIEEYGFPNHRIIGTYNVDYDHVNPSILLFHFDDYDYYSTKLYELIDRGLVEPSNLGDFVDSYQRGDTAQQKYIYGIYDNVYEDQIKDFENLGNRRVSIGMRTREMSEYMNDLKRLSSSN